MKFIYSKDKKLTSIVVLLCLVGPFFFGLTAILCLAAEWERRLVGKVAVISISSADDRLETLEETVLSANIDSDVTLYCVEEMSSSNSELRILS